MTDEFLSLIKEEMDELGIPYSFARWNRKLQYPYWVGTVSEDAHSLESGHQRITLVLTGTTKGTLASLLEQAETIKSAFNGLAGVLPSSKGISVRLVSSQTIPTGNEDFKRIEMTFSAQAFYA